MTNMASPKHPTIRTRVPIMLARTGNKQAELITFRNLSDHLEHIACLFSPLKEIPMVRLHSECFTGDLLGSLLCDCGYQLDEALSQLSNEGGVLLYLRQEGRGIGLYNKLDAYDIQNRFCVDTFEANRLIGRGEDERNYRVAAEMLMALGIEEIQLITNNPNKVEQLEQYGIKILSVKPTGTYITPYNIKYLKDKAIFGGHHLNFNVTDVSK